MPEKQSSTSSLDVMHGVSKVIIIIPLVIVVLALIFKAQQSIPLLNSKTQLSPTPDQSYLSVLASPSPEAPKVTLDLTGPYRCNYIENNASAEAYIKNKNISLKIVQNHTQNIVLNGDCYYKWQANTYAGEKVCGISTYLSLYQSMSALSGGIDLGTILSFAQSSGSMPVASVSAEFMQKTIDSCKKEAVDDAVFKIPTNIAFKESQFSAGTAAGGDDSTGGLGGLGALGGLGGLLNMVSGK